VACTGDDVHDPIVFITVVLVAFPWSKSDFIWRREGLWRPPTLFIVASSGFHVLLCLLSGPWARTLQRSHRHLSGLASIAGRASAMHRVNAAESDNLLRRAGRVFGCRAAPGGLFKIILANFVRRDRAVEGAQVQIICGEISGVEQYILMCHLTPAAGVHFVTLKSRRAFPLAVLAQPTRYRTTQSRFHLSCSRRCSMSC